MKKPYWKWLGAKEFIPGVPARDLTVEEVEGRGIHGLVQTSPLFKFIPAEKQDKKETE